jgi:hypothetical protein
MTELIQNRPRLVEMEAARALAKPERPKSWHGWSSGGDGGEILRLRRLHFVGAGGG